MQKVLLTRIGCRYTCHFCRPQRPYERPDYSRQRNLETLTREIDEAPLECNSFFISGFDCSEDLGLLFEILNYIRFVRPVGTEIQIQSHCAGLRDKALVERLHSFRVSRINLPLYGSTAEVHHTVMAPKPGVVVEGFPQAEAVENCLEVGIEVHVNSLVTPTNEHDLENVIDLLAAMSARHETVLRFSIGPVYHTRRDNEHYKPFKDLAPVVNRVHRHLLGLGDRGRYLDYLFEGFPLCLFETHEPRLSNADFPEKLLQAYTQQVGRPAVRRGALLEGRPADSDLSDPGARPDLQPLPVRRRVRGVPAPGLRGLRDRGFAAGAGVRGRRVSGTGACLGFQFLAWISRVASAGCEREPLQSVRRNVGRFPRFVPPRSLVEVTTRTIQGRYLLGPSRELNAIVLGVLGRAQRLYPLEIHEFKFLSNHYHLLVTPPDAGRLAAFMRYLNGNLAKEICRLHGWRNRVWLRRYRAIVVSDEPAAQIARLDYLLAQGCKEGLVASPREWPGAQGTRALLTGRALEGVWFDRTREFAARVARLDYSPWDFAEKETVVLSPLPCWRGLEPHAVRARIATRVRTIEEETAAEHRRRGTRPVGAAQVRSRDPQYRPDRLSHSPAPRFHVATRAVYWELYAAMSEFLTAYYWARDRIREGLAASYPANCFPSALQFVPP